MPSTRMASTLAAAVLGVGLVLGGAPSARADPSPPPAYPTASATPSRSASPSTTTPSPPSHPTSTPTGRPAPPRPGDHPGRPWQPGHDHPRSPSGPITCADFATQQEAQAFFDSHRSPAYPDPFHLDGNHNGKACEDLDDDGNVRHDGDDPSNTVTPTGDDGSQATTSGSQVTEVPTGSAQTGGA